jgi:D-3-phosphoglycerate dehydrogenase
VYPKRARSAIAAAGKKSAVGSFEIRGKVLGIIGYGSIGSQVSVLAEAMGMKVKFFDVVTKLPLGNAAQVRSMKDLLAQSDIVSLHVPETDATQDMFGSDQIAQMKQGAILINASRGTVVDIEPLAAALKSGHLAGTAIDVFPVEPRSNDDEFISPLRGIDNAILTPHVGGSTQEAQENIGLEVAEKLVKYSDNGTTTSSVNFPEVALPEHGNVHRLLHVHNNVPGVLTKINQIFADNNVNIVSQFLQTNDKVGYVVVDVDADYASIGLQQLREIDGTVRCRVLF